MASAVPAFVGLIKRNSLLVHEIKIRLIAKKLNIFLIVLIFYYITIFIYFVKQPSVIHTCCFAVGEQGGV